MSHRVEVPDALDGKRADVVVATVMDLSRSRAAALLDDGAVTRDGAPVRRSERLVAGQLLEVEVPAPEVEDGAGVPVPPIRYSDDHLLVLAKPPGLVVHPGTGNRSGTLVQALADAGVALAPAGGVDRPGVVHRLDKDTSGLLVVARTDRAHAGLVAALKARTVHRRYVALAEGALPSDRGRVDAPIGRDPTNRLRFAAVEDGRHAVTHWEVAAAGRTPERPVQLVACRLETGRTHQIRVHLAFAGCPVVGDGLYGASPAVAAMSTAWPCRPEERLAM